MRSEASATLPVPVAQTMGGPRQLSAGAILLLWLLVVVPMGLLSLGLAPILIGQFPETNPGLIYWATIIMGMAWQGLVSVCFLAWEGQRWTLPRLQDSLWLRQPRDPVTGHPAWGAMWIVVPLGAVLAFSTDVAFGWMDRALAGHLPEWLTPAYGDILLLATADNTGNWSLFWIALVSCLFNYVLGEAFFFHGILLPRMQGAFGRWSPVANAVLFGAYHVHKAAVWPTVILSCLAYSVPAQYFRSTWPAILIHGVEGLVLMGAVLFVVLGGMTPP